MSILTELAHNKLLLDGGMGTALLDSSIPLEAYGGHCGSLDYLVISAPELVTQVHHSFLQAGSRVITTDTFCASPAMLARYSLCKECARLNEEAVRVAQKAVKSVSGSQSCYVAGSIGPACNNETVAGYRDQISGLLSGGVDLLLIETCRHLSQIETALKAVNLESRNWPFVPKMVSLAVDQNGLLASGENISEVVDKISQWPVDIIGLNCGFGPQELGIFIKEIQDNFSKLIAFYPNAGLPVESSSGWQYPLEKRVFAELVAPIVRQDRVSLFGGCCGVTPDYIAELKKQIG